eukprot:TRINITY_DN873_c0_g2_i1.p2 TRINITY_DN873_c0_g2~~TRINITY_DN873_c0_g2_i1.p2  ORF type:complete len:65 (+),score=3.44 TRINITY_DN873_c0_g2_i1:145-339(+)
MVDHLIAKWIKVIIITNVFNIEQTGDKQPNLTMNKQRFWCDVLLCLVKQAKFSFCNLCKSFCII